MTITEIRTLSTEQLKAQMDEYREELMNLRFQQVTGELKDHTRLSYVRRTIARMFTVLKERERQLLMEGIEGIE
jgi:large subunit ribosomal protein L29